jgi:hypothetical protein
MYCFALGLSNVKGALGRCRVAYSFYRNPEFGVCWANTPVGGVLMHTRYSSLLVAGLLLAGALATTPPASAQTKKESSSMPKVGEMAPDFTLKYFDGNDLKDVKLSDYRGKKNVVLAFYIFAFTGG